MAHQLVKEHHIASGNLAATERIYRCANDYGAIVYNEPPGSDLADRLLVTPVHFSGEGNDSYRMLSEEEATEGVTSGTLLRPKFIFSAQEVDVILNQLCAYTEDPSEEDHETADA